YDERFFMNLEDNELCIRFGKAGYRILYSPLETVVHMYEKGAQKSRKLFKIIMQSMGKIFNKRPSTNNKRHKQNPKTT
ncbi:hypothetical protein ACPTF6_13955, partial [Enterococcus faecalis]